MGRGQPILPGPAHPLGAPVRAWGWGARVWGGAGRMLQAGMECLRGWGGRRLRRQLVSELLP